MARDLCRGRITPPDLYWILPFCVYVKCVKNVKRPSTISEPEGTHPLSTPTPWGYPIHSPLPHSIVPHPWQKSTNGSAPMSMCEHVCTYMYMYVCILNTVNSLFLSSKYFWMALAVRHFVTRILSYREILSIQIFSGFWEIAAFERSQLWRSAVSWGWYAHSSLLQAFASRSKRYM